MQDFNRTLLRSNDIFQYIELKGDGAGDYAIPRFHPVTAIFRWRVQEYERYDVFNLDVICSSQYRACQVNSEMSSLWPPGINCNREENLREVGRGRSFCAY